MTKPIDARIVITVFGMAFTDNKILLRTDGVTDVTFVAINVERQIVPDHYEK